MALIAGVVVAIIGAIIWAAVTMATEYQIGYMALAVGAAVGLSIRFVGKGIDQVFGITGAILAILGCLLGNFLQHYWLRRQRRRLGIYGNLKSCRLRTSFYHS